jgi:hypothetical protein
MYVILYEPDPRMCGPMTYTFHVRDGMRTLGHDCQIVCTTKSGRPRKSWGRPAYGGKWWPQPPDLVVKHEELLDLLDSADVVVMPEIQNISQDRPFKNTGTYPLYVRALLETKTPWTTALHGAAYPPRTEMFIPVLVDAAPGYLVSYSDYSLESNPTFDRGAWAKSQLPYGLRNPVDAPATLRPVTGQLGRFQGNKGQVAGAFAACESLGDGYSHEMWGSCLALQAPSETWLLYKELYEFYPEHQKVRYKDPSKAKDLETEDGNVYTSYNWDFKAEGRCMVRYMGNYTDPVATASRLGVNVALSGVFAGGLVEYASMEAMDAGCLTITPGRFSDPSWFRMTVLNDFEKTCTIGRFIESQLHQAKYVGEALRQCMDVIEQRPDEAHEIVAHNRRAIEVRNNPADVAKLLIECAMTRRP